MSISRPEHVSNIDTLSIHAMLRGAGMRNPLLVRWSDVVCCSPSGYGARVSFDPSRLFPVVFFRTFFE